MPAALTRAGNTACPVWANRNKVGHRPTGQDPLPEAATNLLKAGAGQDHHPKEAAVGHGAAPTPIRAVRDVEPAVVRDGNGTPAGAVRDAVYLH